jgi:hypothetical protein
MHLSEADADATKPILASNGNTKSYQAVEVPTDPSHNDISDTESVYESNEDIIAKRLNGAKRINVLLG